MLGCWQSTLRDLYARTASSLHIHSETPCFMKSHVNAEWPSSLVGVPPSGRRAHHDDVGQRRRRGVASKRRLQCEHRVRRRQIRQRAKGHLHTQTTFKRNSFFGEHLPVSLPLSAMVTNLQEVQFWVHPLLAPPTFRRPIRSSPTPYSRRLRGMNIRISPTFLFYCREGKEAKSTITKVLRSSLEMDQSLILTNVDYLSKKP